MNLPPALTSDLPTSKWGKILGATPVVMTVVATVLAGLASSEMTSAQYDRALGAQLQSKAGDQWNFFQGKKLRAALQRSALDLLGAAADVQPLRRAAMPAAWAATPAGAALAAEAAAPVAAPAPLAAPVQRALAALADGRPDPAVAAVLAPVSDADLAAALAAAQKQAADFDAGLVPVTQSITALEQQAADPSTDAALRRNFTAARVAFEARRYDAEAALNQVVAQLYELQVRKDNLSADRHHRRSANFFYGMLVAQMGVVISTLAMARQRRGVLWALAAGAGAAAVAFSVYVYLCV